MKDNQSQSDGRWSLIDLVGVSGLRWPIVVQGRQHEKQLTIATSKLAVALPGEFKGTHMSQESIHNHAAFAEVEWQRR